jgi:hypothetical protein
MEEKCKYCKGTGFINTDFVETVTAGHRAMYPHTEPCLCRINISINKKFGILSPVNQPLPSDIERIHKTFKQNDILFFGPEDVFLYIVKAYFMKGFMCRNYMLLEGGTIVEQYNVPEPKGEWLTTSHLNQYDLLAILFTTSARYTSLKDCVSEVIKNRNRLAKPTWVFCYNAVMLKEAHEYSDSLAPYFETYKNVDLSTLKKFAGYTPRKTSMLNTEKAMNDAIAQG